LQNKRILSPEVKESLLNRKKCLVQSLLAWNRSNSSPYPWRKTSDPYHILVAEMLLRRTRADRVRSVYKSFLRKFPSLEALSAADTEQIHSLIGSLGLDSRSTWIANISKELDKSFVDRAFCLRYMEIWNFSTSFSLTAAAKHPEYLGKQTRKVYQIRGKMKYTTAQRKN
jgi:hypothetical protein